MFGIGKRHRDAALPVHRLRLKSHHALATSVYEANYELLAYEALSCYVNRLRLESNHALATSVCGLKLRASSV